MSESVHEEQAQSEPEAPPPDAGPAVSAEVWAALFRGDLSRAEAALSPCRGEAAAALWMEVGEAASGLGLGVQARLAFARAAEADPGHAQVALQSLARVAAGEGAHREYAKALVSAGRVSGLPTEPEDRAEALAAVGFAQLRARRIEEARTWLADAVRADPRRWDARTALVRMCAEDGDTLGVDRWVSGAPEPPAAAGGWWMARGDAARLAGDAEQAERFYRAAAEADALACEPAEALVRLGMDGIRSGTGDLARAEGRVDQGLEGLMRRALAARHADRGFVAAACLVGRGAAGPEVRRAYLAWRGALRARPRGAPGPRWVRTWLGTAGHPVEAPELGAALAAPHPEVLADLGLLFGVRAPEFVRAPCWWAGDGRVGVPEGAAPSPRGARFWLARAYAALVEPSLAEGLDDAAEPPSAATRILDRAGLVAVGDPAVALAEVGAMGTRGRDLVTFALSRPFLELRAALGLAVEAPLPKPPFGK